jgi:hypothetical protein
MRIYHLFYPEGSAVIKFPDGTIEEIKRPVEEIISTSSIKEIEGDPTLIGRILEVTARDISKPRIVPSSGKHRAQQIIAHNGRARADEGRVIVSE